MATREENLKKINDELEKLDDEELEQVAGGKLSRRFSDDNQNTDAEGFRKPGNTYGMNFNPQ